MARITDKEKAVADRLRREIGGLQPAFSEELHARLRQALQQYQTENMPMPRRQPTSNWHLRWASVVAAISLLLVIVITWQTINTDRDAGHDATVLAKDRKTSIGIISELANRVTTKTDTMVDSAVKDQRWACLDQDARAVLKTPTARLPFDVVSGLLSMQRQKRSQGPSSHRIIDGG